MKMVKLKYSNKIIHLEPYNTLTEKSILMGSELFEVGDLKMVIDTLSDCITYEGTLTENEMKLVLLKLRSISVGEDIPVKFKCDSCGVPNESVINIKDLYVDNYNEDFTDKFIELTEDNFNDFVTYDVDDLDLDEYDEKFKEVQENIVQFKWERDVPCQQCKEIQVFDISSNKYIVENMSEDTLMSIYKTYNDLIFFSHYTKQDVDSMLPFERSIFIGLLNKTKEDLAK